ncbi:hypothetical protein [Streptacidiphilus melanogenes]|uniref:hypothetical protein n=1 Tax=Streptacidiphilus melanogenes TaxID=411235 RepID=UPI0005AA199D|nr:hypothetical protein [Streptacidiphilus melanogenes]
MRPSGGGSANCEACALEIQQRLGGGRIIEISNRVMPFGGILNYRGESESGWKVHYAVEMDGMVFDDWTGRDGETMEEYMANFDDMGPGSGAEWTGAQRLPGSE